MSATTASKAKMPFHVILLLIVVVPIIIVLLILAIPGAIIVAIGSKLRKQALIARFRREYSAQGRFILFIYSDSPNWKQYIDDYILSKIGRHCVVLNWSERKMWKKSSRWEPELFRRLAPERDFCPMAIMIPPEGGVREVRLHLAFLKFKHGKEDELRAREEELFGLVEQYAGGYTRQQ